MKTIGYKFGDIASFKYGKLPKKGEITDIGKYPIYTGYRFSGNYPSKNLEKGQLIIVARGVGGIGDVKLAERDCFLTNLSISVKVDSQIASPRYLYYYFKQNHLKYLDSGSAQSQITISDLERLEIQIPTLSDQGKIVNVLQSLDEKIKLNYQINKNLMEQLQSLFCQFFISNPESSSWPETTLDKVLLLRNEKVRAGNLPDIPYLPIDLIPTKNLGLTEVRPNQEAKSSLQLFRKNDILIGAMRVYFHRVSIAPFDGITRNTCFVLHPVNPKYLYYLLMVCFQDETIEFANRTSKGSTMPYAVWEDGLGKMPINIPPDNLLSEFNAIAKPMVEMIEVSYSKNDVLTNLRDELLPKLLSGEIELS